LAPEAGSARGGRPAPSIAFGTEGLPEAEQLDAWRGHCSSVIDIVAALGEAPGYAARFEMWSFGHFALSAVRAPPTHFRRTPQHFRRDDLDHWLIHVARDGTQQLRTGARDMAVPPRQPHIVSLDQAFEGKRSQIDWLALFVARDAFPGLGPTIDASRDRPLDGAMGGLLASYIEGLARSLPLMDEAALPRAAEATRAVIAACLDAARPGAPEAEAHVERARLARLRRLIRENLRSPRLGPDRLCKLAGMSRSQLYRLFEPFGGVARAIQAERLRVAHRALSDAEDRRDIIRIAEDCGFFDPSAFSRVFRREFGYAPSELRMTALAGRCAEPMRRLPGGADPQQNFAGALRQL
jgi:AraC-like DNA-binding protein